MSTINPGLNPLSSQFTSRAVRVAGSQAGTVRTKKDTKPQKEANDLPKDSVDIYTQADAMTDSTEATQTGATQQQAKKERAKEQQNEELSMFGGEREVYGEKTNERHDHAGDGKKDVEEVNLDDKLEALAAMNKEPDEILGDVPPHFAAAAQKMVEGKIVKGAPNNELSNLKEVPDTAPIDLEPIQYHDIMPIHDSKNKPMSMEMEANVS